MRSIILVLFLALMNYVISWNFPSFYTNRAMFSYVTRLMSTPSESPVLSESVVSSPNEVPIITKKMSRKKKNTTAAVNPEKVKNRIALTELYLYTRLNYSDSRGSFDVPITNLSLWYELRVQFGEEIDTLNRLLKLKATNKYVNSFLDDVRAPTAYILTYKNKELTYEHKLLTTGRLYVKMKMDPVYADVIDKVPGVYCFSKDPNMNYVVVPVDKDLSDSVRFRGQPPELTKQQKSLTKGSLVKVIRGPYKGKWGYIESLSKGKLIVALSIERIKARESFDLYQLEPLGKKLDLKNFSSEAPIPDYMLQLPLAVDSEYGVDEPEIDDDSIANLTHNDVNTTLSDSELTLRDDLYYAVDPDVRVEEVFPPLTQNPNRVKIAEIVFEHIPDQPKPQVNEFATLDEFISAIALYRRNPKTYKKEDVIRLTPTEINRNMLAEASYIELLASQWSSSNVLDTEL